jgi:hypothetical protein
LFTNYRMVVLSYYSKYKSKSVNKLFTYYGIVVLSYQVSVKGH